MGDERRHLLSLRLRLHPQLVRLLQLAPENRKGQRKRHRHRRRILHVAVRQGQLRAEASHCALRLHPRRQLPLQHRTLQHDGATQHVHRHHRQLKHLAGRHRAGRCRDRPHQPLPTQVLLRVRRQRVRANHRDGVLPRPRRCTYRLRPFLRTRRKGYLRVQAAERLHAPRTEAEGQARLTARTPVRRHPYAHQRQPDGTPRLRRSNLQNRLQRHHNGQHRRDKGRRSVDGLQHGRGRQGGQRGRNTRNHARVPHTHLHRPRQPRPARRQAGAVALRRRNSC